MLFRVAALLFIALVLTTFCYLVIQIVGYFLEILLALKTTQRKYLAINDNFGIIS